MTADSMLTRARWDPLHRIFRRASREGGEERFVMSGVSWQTYQQIDAALGHDRPGPRLYYLERELEIMSTSLPHEEIKKRFADLMLVYLLDTEIETFPHGQATMMRKAKHAGAEPDESWCFHQQKRVPDLVVEIALTSGGLPKLEIYRRFGVSEVWLWRKRHLEIHILRKGKDGYDCATRSQCLPDLDIALLERCLKIENTQKAWRAFRAGLRAR